MLIFLFGGVLIFVAGIPIRFALLITTCSGEDCILGQLSPAAMQSFQDAGLSPAVHAASMIGIDVLLAMVYGAVALLIFLRKSDEWMALLASMWLVTFGLTFSEGEFRAAAAAYPAIQPITALYIVLGGIILLLLFLLMFPSGRFVPRWSRWAYVVTALFFIVLEIASGRAAGVEAADFSFIQIGPFLWATMILGGIVAQVYRYLRVSGPIEKQQTKWVMLGLLFTALNIIMFTLLEAANIPINFLGIEGTGDYRFTILLASFAFMAIPVTIGIAILRYRLWDSDILINRTLVYGMLTAVLVGLYLGSVILLQQITQGLTGHQSPVAIVLSTLLIAALFNPLRRLIQRFIDRRFYRQKYDAQRVLDRFARTAQSETDVSLLTAELVQVVEETIQPDEISVWMRSSDV